MFDESYIVKYTAQEVLEFIIVWLIKNIQVDVVFLK